MNNVAERFAALSHQQLTLLAVELQSRLAAHERRQREPIAIVGMGCRYPYTITTPAAFWQLICAGLDVIGDVPSERWDSDRFYNPDPTVPGTINTRKGGFLPTIDEFDAAFFNISPREAACMDPLHRLFLEVAWEALEDAGLTKSRLDNSRTGVFAGAFAPDHAWLHWNDLTQVDIYSGTGTLHNTLTGRLAYLLNLRGPNVVIDTACSSSLVAVHLACRSLRSGESDIALAGGVNLISSPMSMVMAAQMGILAPDGRCKTFDARADGFGRGEGSGVIVLKRLSDALADGDHIWALIRGTAINQDGKSASLTAPNVLAQQEVIRQALHDAQLEPEQVSFVETHGTGTKLGDPIEVEAIAATYGQAVAEQPCTLGALKVNMGHMEAAAGVSGLIKTVLALQHATLPPNAQFETLNPHITLEGTRLAIPTTAQPWPAGKHGRYGAVSSFGWSGTNAHAIIQEAPPIPARAGDHPDQASLLPLSARSPQALLELAQRYADYLRADDAPSVHDLCYTASLRRTHFEHRLAVVGASHRDLADALDNQIAQIDRAAPPSARVPTDSGLVFVFSGQGSQWAGMGQQLLQTEPVFRAAIDQCAEAFRPHITWSLQEVLNAAPDQEALNQIDIIQPTLFAIQVALVALWRSWGVEPDAVIGHSMGEVAAAHVAGALALDDAARIICRRTQLMRRTSKQGAMAVVELAPDAIRTTLAGYEDRLAVAVNNSPHSVVLSGEPTALDAVLESLETQGVFCRRVQVDVASHSPQMDSLLPELVQILATIQPQQATIPFYSTVTATVQEGRTLDSAYWGRNLREPVQFAQTVQRLLADKNRLFIEMSPHPLLVQAIKEGVHASQQPGLALPALRRNTDERAALLETWGQLYAAGYPLAWEPLYPEGGRVARLPTYPWQHERYWKVSRDVAAPPGPSTGGWPIAATGSPVHPLIGQQLRLAGQEPVFSGGIGDHLPFVDDYRYYGRMVMSAAAYVEISVAAARAGLHLTGALDIRNLTINQALALPTQTTRELQTRVVAHDAAQAELQVWSSAPDSAANAASAWVLHATGQVRALAPDAWPTDTWLDLAAIQQRCPTTIDLPPLLDVAGKKGYEQRASLRGMPTVQRGQHEAVGHWEMPSDYADDLAAYHYHPILLHTSFLLTHVLLDHTAAAERYVSLQFERCRMLGSVSGTRAWLYGRVRPETLDDPVVTSDVWIANEDGQVIAVLEGVDLARGNEHTLLKIEHDHDASYQITWQPHPLPSLPPQTGRWLILADQHEVAGHLAELLTQQGQTAQVLDVSLDDLAAAQRLLAQAGPCTGIVHLGGLEPANGDTLADLEAAQRQGCISILHLVQALAETGWNPVPRLVLVTQEAQRLAGDTHIPAASQRPIWGLGRVIQNEHPELGCTLVDIDHDAASLAGLARELATSAPAPEELALRAGARSVARLEPYTLPQSPAADVLRFKPDATYLLTGGLGGIGLAIARWMVEHGAHHLVLMGRRGITSAEQAQAVDALRTMGAQVYIEQADVASTEAVQAVLTHINQTMPPLRGVLHAAGIASPELLLRESAERFARVMAPKVTGSWNLHQLTLDLPLDFFVLFSSTGSTIVNFGQGSYAAANAFLDGLAAYRQGLGLPATSVNWGLWDNLGMAANLPVDLQDYLDQHGFIGFSREEGLVALGQIIAAQATGATAGLAQVIVAPMNWVQVSKAYQERDVQPLLANRVKTYARQHQRSVAHRAAPTIATELGQTADPARRAHLITHYVGAQVARGLGIAADRLDGQRSLREVGMDSLMALELKKRMETDLGVVLPGRVFFDGHGIDHLVQLVQERLAATSASPANRATPGTATEAAPPNGNGPTVHGAIVHGAIPTTDPGKNAGDSLQGDMAFAPLALPSALTPLFGTTQPTPTLLHAATASPLLTLQSGGAEPPCFLVHAGFGDILSYLPLARYLAHDRPVYAFQAADPTVAPALYSSLQDMATAYRAILQAHQPAGPYLLGGWSFGGAVAFEMARQLWQAGERAITLALLDTWLPTIPYNEVLIAALFFERVCQGFGLACPISFAALRQHPVDQQLRMALEWLQGAGIVDGGTPSTYLANALRIAQATARLAYGYQPGSYSGSLAFYRAEAGIPGAYQGCGFTQDGTIFAAAQRADRTVPGDHSTMMLEPHVGVLADWLRETFAAATSDYTSAVLTQ